MEKSKEGKFTIEDLKDEFYIYISKEHRFGTDSFILSDFAKPKNGDRVCDLGTGCGIISMLLLKTHKLKEVLAVDIQNDAINLLNKSIKKTKAANAITPLLVDLKKIDKRYFCSFDMVISNPPYKAAGCGIMSKNDSAKIARHETMASIYDIVNISSKLLKFGGKLVVSGKSERLVDIICAMKERKIEPKRIKFASKDRLTPPWLVLVEGTLGGKPFLKVEPTLYVYDKNKNKTKEIEDVYNNFNLKGNL